MAVEASELSMSAGEQSSSHSNSDDNADNVTHTDKPSNGLGPERHGTGKRKRGRVNPTQLAHLERAYAQDRSLDATRRKEISEALGMEERQTQIWFQNRRAKAKLLEQRARFQNPNGSGTPLDNFPRNHLSGGLDFTGSSSIPFFSKPGELNAFLQEEDPIGIIPCLDLAIGTWRRIHTTPVDLVAYTCDAQRILTWYIQSSGVGFKMRIPYDTISSIKYYSDFNPSLSQDKAVIVLSKPPTFYREVTSQESGASHRIWRPAYDWTEGTQASVCTRHQIIGIAGQLAHSLRSLPGATTTMTSGGVNYPSPSHSFSSSTDTRVSSSHSSRDSPPPIFGHMSGRPSPTGSALNSGLSRLDHTRSRSHSRPTTPTATNGFTDVDHSAPPFSASLSSSEYNPFPASSDDRSAHSTDFALLPQTSLQLSPLHQQNTGLTRSLSMSNNSNMSRFGNSLSPDPFDPSNGRPIRPLSMITHHSAYQNLPSINVHPSSDAPDGGVNFGANLGPLIPVSGAPNSNAYKQMKDIGDSRLFDVNTGPASNVSSYAISPYLGPAASSPQGYFPLNSEGDRRQYTMSNPRANGNEVLRTPS